MLVEGGFDKSINLGVPGKQLFFTDNLKSSSDYKTLAYNLYLCNRGTRGFHNQCRLAHVWNFDSVLHRTFGNTNLEF